MLKRFPDSALAFAAEGVIPPRALGHAERAEQLQQASRRRARSTIEQATAEVDALHQRARQAGFAAGFAEGLCQAVDALTALLADATQLSGRVRAQAHDALQAALVESGADAEVIAQGCRRLLQTQPGTVSLYLPRDAAAVNEAVRLRLCDALASGRLQLLATDAANAMLHAGPLVLELDLHAPILAAAEGVLDPAAVEQAAAQRGRDYALALQQTVRPASPL